MDEALIIKEKKYISSKRASELTGYTSDYIGQLAKKGKIAYENIGRTTYVVEDEILSYKSISTYRSRSKKNSLSSKSDKSDNKNRSKEYQESDLMNDLKNFVLIDKDLYEESEDSDVSRNDDISMGYGRNKVLDTKIKYESDSSDLIPQTVRNIDILSARYVALRAVRNSIEDRNHGKVSRFNKFIFFVPVVILVILFGNILGTFNQVAKNFRVGNLANQTKTELVYIYKPTFDNLISNYKKIGSIFDRVSLANNSAAVANSSKFVGIKNWLGDIGMVIFKPWLANDSPVVIENQIVKETVREVVSGSSGISTSKTVYVENNDKSYVEYVDQKFFQLKDYVDTIMSRTVSRDQLSRQNDTIVSVLGRTSSGSGASSGVSNLLELDDVSLSSLSYGNLLMYNGSEWVNVSTSSLGIIGGSSSPGGSSGFIQYNNSGTFGGANNFLWDSTNERLGLGTTSPYAKLSVVGEVVAAYFTSTTTATSTFGGNLAIGGTGTSTSAGGLNLTGGCFAINGNCLSIGGGGLSSYDAWTHPAYGGSATTSLLTLSNGFLATASSTIVGNATTTGSQGVGALFVNSDYITDFTGTGLVISGTSLSASLGTSIDLTSEVTGTLPVANGGTGTTSLNDLITLGTHTSGNYLATLSGTTNQITVTGSGSETATPTLSIPNQFNIQQASTTILSVHGGGLYVGTTATTTILGTATSTFGAGIQASYLNLTGTSATSTASSGINLTGGCFAINGNCLSIGGGGLSSYDAWTHPAYGGSATTSLLTLSNGFLATASSTIVGDATTTGTFSVGTRLHVTDQGFGTTTLTGLSISGSATSTSNVGLNLTSGCFAINGTCLSTGGGGGGSDTVWLEAYAGGTGVNQNTTTYLTPGDSAFTSGSTTRFPAPSDITDATICVHISSDQPASQDLTVALQDDDVDTAAVLIIPGGSTAVNSPYCSTTASVSVAKGSLLRYRFSQAAGASSSGGVRKVSVSLTTSSGSGGSGLTSYDAWGHPLFGLSATTSQLLIGTTTASNYQLSISSSTAPQLSLSAGAGFAQTTFRNDGTNFYISTTTVAGNATTSTSALEIALGGFGTTTVRGLNINGQATSTSNVGLNLTGGCFAINGTCLSTGGGGGLSSYDAWTHPSYGGSATTSLLTLSNGLLATASSTISSSLYLPSLSQGFLYNGSNGLTSTIASSSVNLSWFNNDSGYLSSYDAWGHPLFGLSATTSQLLIGTTTASNYQLSISSSTAPQLALSAGEGINQWSFRNAGGNFYLSTTTVSGNATTSISALSIIGSSGYVSVGATSTPFAKLSVQQDSANNAFVIGNSSGTSMLVDENGRVAIGTATIPSFTGTTKFTVSGTSGTNAIVRDTTSFSSIISQGATEGNLILQDTGASSNSQAFNWNSNDGTLSLRVLNDAINGVISTPFAISSNGNVGINTSPSSIKVSIIANDNDGLSISNGTNSTLLFTPVGNGQFRLKTDSSGRWISFADGAGNADTMVVRDGRVGVATTTPSYALNSYSSSAPQLSLSAGAGFAQTTFRNDGTNFYISTTTVAGNATTSTSALEIALGGFGTTTVRGLNINGQATSTSNVGLNLTSGCFAINGTCLSTGGGGGASTTLLADFNTFSNTNNFTGAVGLSSSTPFARLSINADAGEAGLVVGSTTGTSFIVDKNGMVGIGTAVPTKALTISDSGATHTIGNGALSINSLGTTAILELFDSSSEGLAINSISSNTAFTNDGYISFEPGLVESMRLTTGGSLGLGTTTPWAKLSVGITGGDSVPEFVVGGSSSTYFLVNDVGNVGIKTSSPTSALDVNGRIVQRGSVAANLNAYLNTNAGSVASATNLAPGLLVYNDGFGGNFGLDIGNESGSYYTRIFAGDGYGIGFAFSRGAAPTSQSAFDEVMFIKSNGMVGVGTTTPGYQLTIASSTGPQLALSAGAGINQWSFRNAGGNLYISTTTIDGLATTSVSSFSILTSSGNVGIRTDSPASALQIASGQIFAPNGSISAPSYSFGNDSNTGFYLSTGDAIALTSGGTSVFQTEGTTGHLFTDSIFADSSGVEASYSTQATAVNSSAGSSGASSGAINAISDGGGSSIKGAFHAGLFGSSVVDTTNWYALIGQRMGGTNWDSTPAALTQGDYIPGIGFAGQSNTTQGTGMELSASIQGIIDGTVSSGVMPIGLMFRTSSTDSTALAERLRISSAGNIGVATSTPWRSLSINGTAAISGLSNDSTGYYVCLNTTTYEMSTSTTACGASSLRFKKNVQDINYGLDAVLNLRPVSFDYKDTYIKNGPKQLGFIAEEVANVIPELVAYNDAGEIQGLDYPKFTSVLVRGLQELNIKFESLQQQSAFANAQIQSSASSSAMLINQSGTGDILQLQSEGHSVFVINNDGNATLISKSKPEDLVGVLTINNSKGEIFSVNSEGDLKVGGYIYAGRDTAGSVTIEGGEAGVDVFFSRPYPNAPKIVITPQSLTDAQYAITEKRSDGFRIALNKATAAELVFDWIAIYQPEATSFIKIGGSINTNNNTHTSEEVAGVSDENNNATSTPIENQTDSSDDSGIYINTTDEDFIDNNTEVITEELLDLGEDVGNNSVEENIDISSGLSTDTNNDDEPYP